MKLIRDLWMIVIGLYHMIAGDIRDWRRRKTKLAKEPEPAIETHGIKPEPVWGKPHSSKRTVHDIHKAELESMRNPEPSASDWHELQRKNHERMIERHRQIVLKALNQN